MSTPFSLMTSSALSARNKPSAFPPLPYHALRFLQLFSALVVFSILVFFIDHLRDEGYTVPWTFILLITTTTLTLIHLLLSTYYQLAPTHSQPRVLLLPAHTTLLVLHLVSLALLTWNLSWTLGHQCGPTTWHNNVGIMVCRLYKALTAFTVLGTAAAIGLLALDVRVKRLARERGMYGRMGEDWKGNLPKSNGTAAGGTMPIYLDEQRPRTDSYSAAAAADTANTIPSIAINPDYDIRDTPYRVQKPIEAKKFGYDAPSEQTSYAGGNNW